MRAGDLMAWLWRALGAAGSRSLLSALGIAIGIAAVSALSVTRPLGVAIAYVLALGRGEKNMVVTIASRRP